MRKLTLGGRLQLGRRGPLLHVEQGRGRFSDRQLHLADRRQFIEVVGTNRALGEPVNFCHETGAWDAAAAFPVVPNLPDRTNGSRASIQLELLLNSPRFKRVKVPVAHPQACKIIAYSLAIAVRDREPIFVSAEILPFLPMFTDPNRIRELRLARDWSQQRLADLIGVSKVTISDLERGKMALTVDYMRRIAGALSTSGERVAAADLLTLDDNPYLPRSGDERELVNDYRDADDAQREIIRRVAKPIGRRNQAA